MVVPLPRPKRAGIFVCPNFYIHHMETTTTSQTPNPVANASKWYTNKDVIEVAFKIAVALTTSLYVTGYLSWATFAYYNGLGFLPALREQYVIAGLLPVLAFACGIPIYFATLHLGDFLDIQVQSILRKNLRGGLLLIVLITFSGYAAFLLAYFFIGIASLDYGSGLNVSYIIYAIVLLYVGSLFLGVGNYGGYINLFFSLAFKITAGLAVFAAFALVYFLYTTAYFPSLPREFGGPKAEPYTFDVNRTELSDKTLSMICEDDWVAENNGQNVYSTDTLYLIFDSDEYLLLKKYDRDLGKDNPLIKLKTGCVRAQFPLR
jgi:hypothetical protein